MGKNIPHPKNAVTPSLLPSRDLTSVKCFSPALLIRTWEFVKVHSKKGQEKEILRAILFSEVANSHI